MNTCPCRLMDEVKLELGQCCGPYLSGTKNAPTAESLMRSRYSAYATYNMGYLEKTHKHNHGEKFDQEAALKWAKESHWNGLKIHSTSNGNENDLKGMVEFSAFYNDIKSGKPLEHKEKSSFEKIEEKWIFIEGLVVGADPLKRTSPKVGRNDPCHCGSGKKFKKCCGI